MELGLQNNEKKLSHAPTGKPPEGTVAQHKLPVPIYHVLWKDRCIVTMCPGGKCERARGITRHISKRLNDLDLRLSGRYKQTMERCCRKGRRAMLRTGQDVDRELKSYAKGKYSLKRKESLSILEELTQKGIVLIDSAVLVSNFSLCKQSTQKATTMHGFSGTEIDLVGYDSARNKYVIIEIKVTSVRIKSLLEKNSSSSIDKTSGFRISTLGCFAAQLACTTIMFRQTYNRSDCYGMLIVCEADTAISMSFVIKAGLIRPERFRGWIPGF